MKKRTKIILSVLGIVVFSVVATVLIVTNNKKIDASDNADADSSTIYAVEESVSSSSSSASSQELEFPDTREFTPEQIAMDEENEPEGADHYEVDEEGPMYHVMVYNFEEIYEHYDDFKICNELPYYLHTYFNLCTGNLDEMYDVTITEGSFESSEYSTLATFEATVDKYPDMIIYIEYDKAEREFGIKSDLGDYSLDALRTSGTDLSIYYDEEEAAQEEDTSVAPAALGND
ncbi:MAG: hypothetical protein K6A23_05025 [Butyrivibrio sp.]|nr:hypothetical protein [Butyrivibrio sp.]